MFKPRRTDPGKANADAPLSSRRPTIDRRSLLMTRSLAGLALVLAWISSAGPAGAAPPTIKATVPFGVCRGTPTEVTIEGTNLKGTPELVAPFAFTIQPPSGPNADAGHWKATFTVAADAALGAY